MASAQEAANYLNQTPHKPDRLATSEFEQADGVADEVSTIASIQMQRLATVRPEAYDLDIPAYESFTSDSTTGDTDTFDLAHYPMQSAGAARQFVLYAGGDRVPSSEYTVNWDANTFDYTGDETANDLHAFYFSRQQARVEIRKVAPNGTFEKLDEADVSMLNMADVNEDTLAFEFQHALQGVVPAFWTLEVRVDAPYTVAWSVSTGDGGTATADQMLVDVPINRASESVPDWVGSVVGGVAGAR